MEQERLVKEFSNGVSDVVVRVVLFTTKTGCKRRREIVALGGGKVQRLACLNYSLERGWQLTARVCSLIRLCTGLA